MPHRGTQALQRRGVGCLGFRARPSSAALRGCEHGHPRQGYRQARSDPGGRAGSPDDLHRRGQWLRRGFRAVHPGCAQALARHHHHGRQRRHQGDDGGAHLQRRGHHQGRHWPRQRLHHAQADGRGLPPALRGPRVRGRGARPGRPHRLGRRLHLPRRRLQGLRRRRGLHNARGHAGGPRGVRGGGHPGGRQLLQGLLRHVQRHRHGEARGRRGGVQVLRGQDREVAVPWPHGRDRPGHPGRHALGLHVRRGVGAPGALEADDLHPLHAAAQQRLHGVDKGEPGAGGATGGEKAARGEGLQRDP
mmetsp:Transcript_108884/g.351512  ORF Transcript_108884/g.351512 Transcript_108884/m.351512 type:complete len:304 (-) Transcript_108884:218-1129(-)